MYTQKPAPRSCGMRLCDDRTIEDIPVVDEHDLFNPIPGVRLRRSPHPMSHRQHSANPISGQALGS